MTTVIVSPFADPGLGRRAFEAPDGDTVAELVAAAFPCASDADLDGLRVVLVTDRGSNTCERPLWAIARPRADVRIVLHMIPRGAAVGALVSAIVQSVAQVLTPVITSAFGSLAGSTFLTGIVTAGLTLLGSYLINSLVQPDRSRRNSDSSVRDVFTLSGWQNDIRPGDVVPWVAGRHRYAPPYIAQPYSEIVGDQQFIRGLFGFGYGPLSIEDVRLGDTSIDEFEDIQMELREGRDNDEPVTLYPEQVLEENLGVQLIRPKPRDAAGNEISGDNVSSPIVRQTASDAAFASVILVFSGGLFRVDSDGDQKSLSVSVRIRQRQNDDPWQDVVTLDINASKRETFFRQHKWELPSRGRWEIEVERMTNDRTSTRSSDKVSWLVLQSVRPEYPVNIDKPMAMLAMRIRATYQLNGPLDSVNAVVTRLTKAPDSEGVWAETASRNPAAAFVAMLQGPHSPFPVTDAEIDWDLVRDWHDWCETKGLKYDRIHDQEQSLGEALRMIARAGRAAPRHDGLRWGVVIDRPDELIVDHVSARNTDGLRWEQTYFDPPDGLRVPFLDETNGWKPSERIVPWIGVDGGDVSLTEELSLPGKTDPDEIWIEARRVMYEAAHRRLAITGVQEGRIRVATRGDAVMASLPMLDTDQAAAVVTRVDGPLVELDADVAMQDGQAYGLRFRVFADAQDTVGQSVIVGLVSRPGPSRLVTLESAVQTPLEGHMVHIGPIASDSLACRIQTIEPTEQGGAFLRLIPAAPIIDTLTDAETPPAWDVSVGSSASINYDPPLAPSFTRIFSGSDGVVIAELSPNASDITPLLSMVVEHRMQGATTWTRSALPVSQGSIEITDYDRGDTIELRAFARALDATDGALSVEITHDVGSGSAEIPAALEDESIAVTGGPGHATITVTATDPATTRVLICRVPLGEILDPDIHAIGSAFAIANGVSTTFVDGDITRTNQLTNGGFDDGSGWTAGGGWSISGGEATVVMGVSGDLDQVFDPDGGATYRIFVSMQGRTAGDLQVGFKGGTEAFAAAIEANGITTASVVAASSHDTITFRASAGFDGVIDDVGAYRITTASLSPGAYDYHLIPVNDEDVQGPASAAFLTTIL